MFLHILGHVLEPKMSLWFLVSIGIRVVGVAVLGGLLLLVQDLGRGREGSRPGRGDGRESTP